MQHPVEVIIETVWLSQQQMAELFDSTIPNISMHIRNVYNEGELDKDDQTDGVKFPKYLSELRMYKTACMA